MRELSTEALLAELRARVEIESPTQGGGGGEGGGKFRRGAAPGARRGHRAHPAPGGFSDISVGRLPGAEPQPGLLLLGHRDTVHPLGTLAGPLPFRMASELAYGPGIHDPPSTT